MSMIVCGIDPSLVRTAVCISDASGADAFAMQCFGSKPVGKDARSRMYRVEALVGRICDWIEPYAPDVICLEHYSLGSQYMTAALCEFGGILRWNLLDVLGASGCLFEIAPGTLKKFATGKGNADKNQMGAHVAKRYGHVFGGDDEVDAFALWELGMCLVHHERCANAIQYECVRTVLGHTTIEEDEQATDRRVADILSK